MDDDWHTLLKPGLRSAGVMKLARGTYRFALNSDGTCCRFVLVDIDAFSNALFPPVGPVDNSTVMGAAQRAGDITTKDISTFLFPNTYLYFLGDPHNCCVIGFHTYDEEPGDARNGNRPRRYVMNYSSWISAGLFNRIQDITALSHEIAEIYNDPFVASDGIHNVTPWWLAPNGNCQDTLETGDVIEGLPMEVFPITMNGMTYHPQNEALLQWFKGVRSNALNGAFSYPDERVLTTPMVSQKPNCQP